MDHRIYGSWRKIESSDEKRMVIAVEIGEEQQRCELPMKFELCETCQGRGKHVNPNIDEHGWNPQDYEDDQAYWDGNYDVTCYECGGRRVVPVVDEEVLNPQERVIFEQWQSEEQDRIQGLIDDYRERQAEQRFCGYY